MKISDKTTQDFLDTNRIGVVSVQMKDKSPHGATVHFSQTFDPVKIYILTNKKYKKCEAMLDGSTVKASFVVGTDESLMQTFQSDGDARIVFDKEELERIMGIHFKKISSALKHKDDPDRVFIEFTPTWYRFRNYKAKPLSEIESRE